MRLPLIHSLVLLPITAASWLDQVALGPIVNSTSPEIAALNYLKCLQVNGADNSTQVLIDGSSSLIVYFNTTQVNTAAVTAVTDYCSIRYLAHVRNEVVLADSIAEYYTQWSTLGRVLTGTDRLPSLELWDKIAGGATYMNENSGTIM
ncbi:hypothetical protein KAFR_0C06105 [Kazachstania africana CBS 2517]|uniref:Uncharacterized protein n=1 Tax=Kazachstania africana (strain ATCC 22294 / BCRC 22015 / CBS 2517 / CECT 1963 / NBRC 1671 / NRRL Y-8276) TaxID=1071382 RepID=H2ATA2_KAZAF|nr:hypothetical protein KAFR_0C06105 [Kazachstania africana CBS 2517]CCF57602.1 hypothetical protein KAFR_0C06105 [Kazachstania africana CBS 2517]